MFWAVLLFFLPLYRADVKTLQDNVPNLAKAISCNLHDIFNNNTGYSILLERYSGANITCQPFTSEDYDEVFGKISNATSAVMRDKETKLKTKAKKIEEFLANEYEYTEVDYYDSDYRRSEGNEFVVEDTLHFPYETNKTSAVYIPVILVNDSTSILNDISWTTWLDKDPHADNDTLFVGTVNGVLRFYPGTTWPTVNDMYDCRLQSWFLQAGSSKHDIAMLIDRSGSVTGITLRTIKRIAKLLLNIIPNSYRFNVILFNNDTKPLVPCYGMRPLPATDETKNAMISAFDEIQAKEPGYFDKALRNLQDSFFDTSENDGNCKRKMIVLFTDGMIDFSTDTIKRTLSNMDVKLLVLDFSSPLSPGINRQLYDMACAVGGNYVFIKRISDWFQVAEMFFNTVCSRDVTVASSRKTSPHWSDPTISFYGKKSMILSVPVYNRTSKAAQLAGVLGTEVLLSEFVNAVAGEAGSLMYETVSLPSGRVVSHPRLLSANNIPFVSQVETSKDGTGTTSSLYPNETLYPIEDMMNAPIITTAAIIEKRIGQLNYKLTVPKNDGYRVTIGGVLNRTDLSAADDIVEESIYKTLFVRPSYTYSYRIVNKPGQIRMFQFTWCNGVLTRPLIDACPAFEDYVLPILRDIMVTNDTFASWAQNQSDSQLSRGNFLVTRHGVLRSTVKDVKTPDPSQFEEWREFAGNPDKFPAGTLLVTSLWNRANLTKSIQTKTATNESVVLAILGMSLKSNQFSNLVNDLLSRYGMDKKNIRTNLLDHKGYVVYSSDESVVPQTFFGKVNGVVFQRILHRGYYVDKVFTDCLRLCPEDPEATVASGVRIMSMFVRDGLLKMFSVTVAVLYQAVLYPVTVSGFKKPDLRLNRRCCRQIHSFERDFSVSNLYIDSYNRCGSVGLSCIEIVSVIPVPKSNLLLVAIIPSHNRSCNCNQVTIERANEGLEYSDCQQEDATVQPNIHTYPCFDDNIKYNRTVCDDG